MIFPDNVDISDALEYLLSLHRIFICDGDADDVEFQQAIDWIAEDPENRTAEIHTSRGKTNEN